MHWRRKWQPTPVFLPGESQGRGAWWAAVYGVAQSWTWLKWLSSSSMCLPSAPATGFTGNSWDYLRSISPINGSLLDVSLGSLPLTWIGNLKINCQCFQYCLWALIWIWVWATARLPDLQWTDNSCSSDYALTRPHNGRNTCSTVKINFFFSGTSNITSQKVAFLSQSCKGSRWPTTHFCSCRTLCTMPICHFL